VQVDGLENVRSIAAIVEVSFAVTKSGGVFRLGSSTRRRDDQSLGYGGDALRPFIVEGLEGVRVRCVIAEHVKTFTIGEDGELFSWGFGFSGQEMLLLGHGDMQVQLTPKRVEALRGVMVIGVAMGQSHALALTVDGLVYAWGDNWERAVLGNPHAERELMPKPVEALRGVRVGSIAAADTRSYALADTGELWAWGCDLSSGTPLGNDELVDCPLPKPMEWFRQQGIRIDAVVISHSETAALADDGRVFMWGFLITTEEDGSDSEYSRIETPMLLPMQQRVSASYAV
jgi:E3 ubiquitin-protein ligase HERC2